MQIWCNGSTSASQAFSRSSNLLICSNLLYNDGMRKSIILKLPPTEGVINKKAWDECKKKNSNDPYSKACVDVAERVMQILDEDRAPLHFGYFPDIHTPHGIICRADKEVVGGGLSGFQASCIRVMVRECHARGKEFDRCYDPPPGYFDSNPV